MKVTTLSLLAGAGGALILTGTAPAEFAGVKVVQKPGGLEHGLVTLNVYAVFDRPDDEFIAVAGTPDNPLSIRVFGGDFFQHPQGATLTAPFLQFLPGNPPTLAYDTFVTIGTKTNDLFSTLDDVSTTPGLAFQDDRIETTNAAWFILPSGPGNGGLGAPNANGQVLLFQGSVSLKDNPNFTGMGGTMLLKYSTNEIAGIQVYVEFFVPAPAGGAIIAAGMLGHRRRRRLQEPPRCACGSARAPVPATG